MTAIAGPALRSMKGAAEHTLAADGCRLMTRRPPGRGPVRARTLLIWTPTVGRFCAGAAPGHALYAGDFALVGGGVELDPSAVADDGRGLVHALGVEDTMLTEIAAELQAVSRTRIELRRLLQRIAERPFVDRQPDWLAGLLADLDQAATLGLRDPGWLRRHARLVWERLIFSRAVRRPDRPPGARRPRPTRRRSGLEQRLRRVRQLLESEYHRPLDLSQMASVACVSRYHFLREFRKAFGQTPYQLLLDIRLTAARRMLETGELPVQEIGRRVGFASPDGFYRAFRRRYQRSPTAFRVAG